MKQAVDRLERVLISLCAQLGAAHDALPHVADRLFFRFRKVCLERRPEIVRALLERPVIERLAPRFRAISAHIETLSEWYWSKKILASRTSGRAALRGYTYYQAFARTASISFDDLKILLGGRPARRCLFVGAGPLPLTAVLMADYFGVRVDTLEIEEAAFHQGRAFIKTIGYSTKVRFIKADAFTFDYQPYDVIVAASLVGEHEREKIRLLRRIARTAPMGAVVLARTAHDLKTLMYQPVPEKDYGPLKIQLTVKPYDPELMANSYIMFKKKP